MSQLQAALMNVPVAVAAQQSEVLFFVVAAL
jgi:hypothetical protein